MKLILSILLTTFGAGGGHNAGQNSASSPQSTQPAQQADLQAQIDELRRDLDAQRTLLEQMLELDRSRAELLSRALARGGVVLRGRDLRPTNGNLPAETQRPPTLDGADQSAALLGAKAIRTVAATGTNDDPRSAATDALARTGVRAKSGKGAIRGTVKAFAGVPAIYVFVENLRGKPAPSRVQIRQVNKSFQPDWAVVQVGATIEFPNNDNIHHNVFSLSPGNSFDLGLYRAGSTPRSQTFTTAGTVDVYCNIHPSMSANILVVPNAYFAKADTSGTFVIPDVPEGRRKIVAWAPGAEITSEWVDVSSRSDAEVTLALSPRSAAHKNKLGLPYGSYE